MSRKQDRYASRPRSLTSHYGSSPSMFGSKFSGQYSSPYSNSYSNVYSPYRNFNPYTAGIGRPSNLGIYGGTSSGYGGVYLSGASLGSLNLMTPVMKKIDKKLMASQKNFKPKPVPLPAKAPAESAPETEAEAAPGTEVEAPQVPPVRPERKPRSTKRSGDLNKERSRSLTDLDYVPSLHSRSLSLRSVASDGYCSGSERTDATQDGKDLDYKAMYEDSQHEVRRLEELVALLNQTNDTMRRADEFCWLSQVNSMAEKEKREKRAMERKLSEMEEELKQLQKLKAENERLRAENRALTRVISKMTNSAAK